MASTFEQMGELETAMNYNLKVIQLTNQNKKYQMIKAYALQNLGTAYSKLYNTSEAELHLKAALRNFLKINDKSGIVKTRKFLAQPYLKTHNSRAAIAELSKALPLCKKLKEYPQLLEILFSLAE